MISSSRKVSRTESSTYSTRGSAECSKVVSVIFIFSACSTPLSLLDINNLNKVEFEPLFISSACELLDLRIDIIRQTYEYQVNDSTNETKKVPYHKLGFNLGNGLFYDLNDNLSIRIDYLLDIDTKNNFEIEKSYEWPKWNRIVSNNGGIYHAQYPNRNREYDILKIDRFNDSLSISYKERFRYAIIQDDTSLTYLNRKKIIDKIQKKEENFYYQSRRKGADEFRLIENEVILKNKYKLLLNQGRKTIEINRIGKNTDIPGFKIIRDENTIFIYNRKYYGKKIVLEKGGFKLYHNESFGYEYKRRE